MNKKETIIKFVIFFVVYVIIWPLLDKLYCLITGSTFYFDIPRICVGGLEFAVLFVLIIPWAVGKFKKNKANKEQ